MFFSVADALKPRANKFSILLFQASRNFVSQTFARVAQLAEASDLGSGCWRFESSRGQFFGWPVNFRVHRPIAFFSLISPKFRL